MNLIAGKDPFEIWATRKSYADPIVAKQIVQKKGTVLPAGIVKDFYKGLTNFTTITIKDKAGSTVKSYQTNFCPGSYGSARSRPDAPASSPYPMGCSENPFTLGRGVGPARRAGTRRSRAGRTSRTSSISAGDYSVTVTVNKAYVDYFKLKNATADLNLKVENITDGKAGRARPGRRTRPPGCARRRPTMATATTPATCRACGRRPRRRPPRSRRPRPVRGPTCGRWPGASRWRRARTTGPASPPASGTATSAPRSGTLAVPLVVDGFRRPGTDLMDAYQYFFDAEGNQVGYHPAGTMEWAPGRHTLALHRLRPVRPAGRRHDLAVRSDKKSFCLANTDASTTRCPRRLEAREHRPARRLRRVDALSVREVLDIGTGDTYSQDRTGPVFASTTCPTAPTTSGSPRTRRTSSPRPAPATTRHCGRSSWAARPGARTLTVPPVNGITG